MENSPRFEELVSDFEERLDRHLNDREKELLAWIVKKKVISMFNNLQLTFSYFKKLSDV
ncbi:MULTISPECIES: hypothetical protein [Priestia]|uniref:hypothetical protein n=1 Tax=Priestia TaxID=2800373 RepID=UPI001C8E69A5|nr:MULTISPECIES: hypothetical protein [Priestia]MBX9996920.1 hypothetical protein [Priestia aryabhattai]